MTELLTEWTFWVAALAWTFIFGYLINALTPVINERLARSWAWFKRRRVAALMKRYKHHRLHAERGSLIFVASYRAFLVLTTQTLLIALVILRFVISPLPPASGNLTDELLTYRGLYAAVAGLALGLTINLIHDWIWDVFYFGMDSEDYRRRTLRTLRKLDPDFDEASLDAQVH